MTGIPEPPTDEHGPAEFESHHTLSPDEGETLQDGGTVSFWISTNEVVHLEVGE